MRQLSRYALFVLALAVLASAFCSPPLLNRAFVNVTHYYLSVLCSGINPHGLATSGKFETKRMVERHRIYIGDQNLLMKLAIFRLHGLHHLLSDSASLKGGMNEQMSIVRNQMTIRNSVANTDQPIFNSRSNQ